VSLVADCSTSYSRPPTVAEAALWKSLGLTRMIVGTSFSPDAGHTAAWSQVVDVEEYQFPRALRSTGRAWWVDAETPAATRETVRDALDRGARGIYTRRGWWLENMGAWDLQAEYPAAELWDARYVGTAKHGTPGEPCLIVQALNAGDAQRVRDAIAAERATTPRFKLYAGFARAALTQWHNSIVIYGINVDLNEAEEVAGMASAEYQELKQLIGNVYGGLGATNERTSQLERDVRGVFKFSLDHINDGRSHASVPPVAEDVDALEERIADLDRRIEAASRALRG
jgi:hypothetical protein